MIKLEILFSLLSTILKKIPTMSLLTIQECHYIFQFTEEHSIMPQRKYWHMYILNSMFLDRSLKTILLLILC